MTQDDTDIPELAAFKAHTAGLGEGLKNFVELLNELESLDDNKKSLWKEIYVNAVTDRRASYTLYVDLLASVVGSAANHAIHGPVLAKYIERMTRSNDQIIRLAELVADAQAAEAVVNSNPADLYEKISRSESKRK